MIRNLLKPLSFVPALLLMYMIFSFSAQTGDESAQLSYQVSCKIIEAADFIFDAGLDEWQIAEWANKINFITRKLAHMTEYFALAVAVSFPLYVYGMHGILLMLVAGMICVGFACGDEYHQAFVADRGPSVKDVCIDSVGVFFGIIFVRIIGWTGRQTIFKPKEKKNKRPKGRKAKYAEDEYYDEGYREPRYERGAYREQPYSRGGYQEEPYDRGGYRQQPYDRSGYQEQSYGRDSYRQQPYNRDGYQAQPYDRNGYRQQSYDRDGYRQQPRDGYGQSSYGQSGYRQDNGYQGQASGRSDGYRYQSEGWLDEEDIDISSPRDESYDADWQDPSRANDWGMDEQPQERQAQERPEREPSRSRRPVQEQEPQPHKKKKVKKEKDWFFDM